MGLTQSRMRRSCCSTCSCVPTYLFVCNWKLAAGSHGLLSRLRVGFGQEAFSVERWRRQRFAVFTDMHWYCCCAAVITIQARLGHGITPGLHTRAGITNNGAALPPLCSAALPGCVYRLAAFAVQAALAPLAEHSPAAPGAHPASSHCKALLSLPRCHPCCSRKALAGCRVRQAAPNTGACCVTSHTALFVWSSAMFIAPRCRLACTARLALRWRRCSRWACWRP
ncbi:hypothetical protein COO60DRAFT_1555419 [Scenedesmus sp. NREL 46B-D3]|nr:hypothetical protein COO60DRAFT_1555419 [Scenedesmus sp. NREL 46B-D3]